ncbi:MAG TPA: ATPase-like protein [Candidatus Hydrogenedentes bacterium]|nr:ATPase-like protein [Candidatus Hydrogenedentota bacterium]
MALQQGPKGPVVEEESLRWPRKEGKAGRPFAFLDFKRGEGMVVSGEVPDESAPRHEVKLESPDILAVSTLGQFADHPRVSALRRLITGWYLSYLSADSARGIPEAGPQERLTANGDNLPNVMQYLKESHPDHLQTILETLSTRVPRLESVQAEMMPDGRLLLQIKDAPFQEPIQANFVSDGTLKMLAYLLVLYDPEPPQIIGIEEPENQLHPRLLPGLAEECRQAAARSQLIVMTHSPSFVNALRPEELWVLYRDNQGFTQAKRAVDMKGIREFMEHGALLGDLWIEGHFEFGDPLRNQGGPGQRGTRAKTRRDA